LALKPGDEISAGRVFRRSPNLKSRFDLKTKRPKIGVFRPAPEDDWELSVHLESLASLEKVLGVIATNPTLQPFGLYALDIEKVKAEAGKKARFVYKPDPDDPDLGDAHVIVPNCDEDLQAILLKHSVVVKAPAPPLK
jgi:hypothetical protein